MKSGLYPPILDTYMPSFSDSSVCKINFTISPYSSGTFSSVQMIVTNQFSNQTMLDIEKYPLEIVQKDCIPNGDGTYSVVLEKDDLKDGHFETDIYYKVQLRLSTTKTNEFNAAFIAENINNFSEWSKPCLIRYIGEVQLHMEGLDNTSLANSKKFFSTLNHFRGYLECLQSKTEYLYNYRLKLFRRENGQSTLIADSALQYTDEFGDKAIDYNFNLRLEDYFLYELVVEYATNNGYTNSQSFYFQVLAAGLAPIKGDIILTPDRARGSIKVKIEGKGSIASNIMIRRTSNKSLYTTWEDVHLFSKLEDGDWIYEWEDFLVETGVIYLYGIQLYEKIRGEENKEIRGEILTADEKTTLALFEHSFLYDGERQLRLQYDLNISSLKHTILDSKVETLGSQYPFIRRNAKVNYRTFPISGIISYKMDDYSNDYPLDGIESNKWFVDFKIAKEATPLFFDMRNYNEKTKEGNLEITNIKKVLSLESKANYDIDLEVLLEKKFRDEVIKFLQDGKVKLLKSETEGNILVRLMDVSFTPNKILGRRIYSFSATAYEIDAPTIDSYKKYNLLNIGSYNWDLSKTYDLLSQITNQASHSIDLGMPVNDVMNLIKTKVNTETLRTSSVMQGLKWARIIFNTPPYYISQQDIINFRIRGSAGSRLKHQYELTTDKYLYGYLIRIETLNNGVRNTSVHIVNPHGVFEFSSAEFSNVVSIQIAAPVLIEETAEGSFLDRQKIIYFDVDFLVSMKKSAKDDDKIESITKNTFTGQMRESFGLGVSQNFINKLLYKYSTQYRGEDGKRHFTKLDSINGLEIDAPPGTIVKIQDTRDAVTNGAAYEHTHVIGATGIYHVYNKDGVITSGYFDGIRLIRSAENETRKQVREHEYKMLPETTVFDKLFPVYHGVYTIGNKKKIYYNDNLWDFEEESETVGIVRCPIEASINYYGEITKGTYQT